MSEDKELKQWKEKLFYSKNLAGSMLSQFV